MNPNIMQNQENATGSKEGSLDFSDDSSTFSRVDLREDKEWEDVESDEEEGVQYVSLVDDRTFPNLRSMFEHVRTASSIDFPGLCHDFGLEFLQKIKLVNYLRSESRKGNTQPDVSSAELFADDQYLQPVLEDDAVLYHLDELESPTNEEDEALTRQQYELTEIALVEADQAAWRANYPEYNPATAEVERRPELASAEDEDYFGSYGTSGRMFSSPVRCYQLKVYRHPRDNAQGQGPDQCVRHLHRAESATFQGQTDP